MKTNLNNWLQKNPVHCRDRLVCNDGTTLSVQASHSHYCKPRADTEEGVNYSRIEVWCISCDVPDSWSDYGNPESDPYAYIPIGMVEEFIEMHGGIEE